MEPKVEFLTGVAGTGKTYTAKQRITKSKETPGIRNYGTLCATTGIAAVNLSGGSQDTSVCTINSELGFFDSEDMLDKSAEGKIFNRLKNVSVKGQNLVVDEVSMMDSNILDCLYDNLVEVNKLDWVQGKGGLGLVIIGDFCQLPPVKGEYAFKGRHWGKFVGNTTKLTHIWRQSNKGYIEALNAARSGDGDKTGEILAGLKGISWREQLNSRFDGTTIVATNKEVERINQSRLTRLISEGNKSIKLKNFRWGQQRPEWRLIPDELELVENVYVMILSNNTPEFSYANGDCGKLQGVHTEFDRICWIELARNNVEVQVAPVKRRIQSKFTPDGMTEPKYDKTLKEWKEGGKVDKDSDEVPSKQYKRYLTKLTMDNKPEWGKIWFDYVEHKWVVGEIDYVPLRLAYSSTVHKCVSPNTTLLVKDRGLLPICKISTGDYVFTGKSYRKVVGYWPHQEKELWKVRTKQGLSLACSSEHRVNTQRGFITVDNLIEGDTLQVPINIPEYVSETKAEVINSDIAYLLGLLIGDGCISDKKEGNIHFCCSDEYLQDRFSNILLEQFNIQSNNRRDGKGSFATSVGIRKQLEELGLTYAIAPSKEIPKSVLSSATLPDFLRGLYDTDGHVGKSGIVLTTSSAKIAKQVSLALWVLQIPNKRKKYPGVNDSYYWQVRINANGVERFRELIGFERPYKVAQLEFLAPNRIIVKATEWDEVVEVYNTGLVIPMIDIEVEGEHTYWADGIVTHNCQGLSLDRIQIDFNHNFFGGGSMSYVALSRCKTPEGLVIVGSPKLVAARTNILGDIVPWI